MNAIFIPAILATRSRAGTMEILDQNGTRRVDIAAGSYFSSEGIDWHEGLNVGDTVVQYLMIEPR